MIGLVVCTGFGVFLWRTPRWVTVDLGALIRQETSNLVSRSGRVPSSDSLQRVADRLKAIIDTYARQHRVVIVAKGAVFGGTLPDHTDAIAAFRASATEPIPGA